MMMPEQEIRVSVGKGGQEGDFRRNAHVLHSIRLEISPEACLGLLDVPVVRPKRSLISVEH